MSHSLDPDWTQQNVGPDLDPNCLQNLLTVRLEETEHQKANGL